MGIDKARAKSRGWRISESTFYMLSLLLGYTGIIAGLITFHHKTRKIIFQLINFLMFIMGIIIGSIILPFIDKLLLI